MSTIILAYLGPETMLPLTSVIAAAVGGFMMFGRGLARIVMGTIRRRFGRRKSSRVNAPHFRAKRTVHSSTREAGVREAE